ncbi:hypothetical protein BRARA_C01032 [Brassica rapa]|uniref:Defensin-like protein n=5 Tax=Brassica TaxID=3705 RepID=A0A397ZTM8_BRACM|nr:putative defensin-like protein 274 [Brassica rapa]XP_022568731.1 putative defensin-like protein 274 [Brassica napus]KAG5403557.1 hypothetical protein IGI04_009676 [Brassica rapa subsp. trilocularis]VDC87234.1 unnamed protein product [Brassica oleracea]KAH0931900.1 hypothetical protein HID58_009017 [Brassica napus]RID68902.1 hypothetical protein BRARA_C01032 [Brassica rapa]CAF2120842.1 unnamed protein product [Brassica napus]
MASSRFQLVALLVIFSLVITAQSNLTEKEEMDGPCRLRGTCDEDSDCDTHCHRSTDAVKMDGHCLFDRPTPVCCCLFD